MRRLIIRPGAIGDFVVSLPALEHLKCAYTEVWTTEANAPLVRFADRVDTIVRAGLDALELSEVVLARLGAFESIVSWYGSERNEFREAVSGLPFTFHRALPEGGLHATDFYLRQVGAPAGGAARLPVERRDEGRIVIHPFSGSAAKNWPFERYREVAEAMELPVYWTAGPEEALDGAARFDDLWELAQWLAGASLYIGNDSGITHLAAACGIPVIAIFGRSDARVWAPRGDVTVLEWPEPAEVIAASRRRLP